MQYVRRITEKTCTTAHSFYLTEAQKIRKRHEATEAPECGCGCGDRVVDSWHKCKSCMKGVANGWCIDEDTHICRKCSASSLPTPLAGNKRRICHVCDLTLASVDSALCFECDNVAHRNCSHIVGENRTTCYACLREDTMPSNFSIGFRDDAPPMFEGEKLDTSRMLEGRAPHQRDLHTDGKALLCAGFIAMRKVTRVNDLCLLLCSLFFIELQKYDV